MTDYRPAPYLLQPPAERLIWPWIIGIILIAFGARDFLFGVTSLANFFPALKFSGPGLGNTWLSVIAQLADAAARILIPAFGALAGLSLLKWRRPALVIPYALVAICWAIAYTSYFIYDFFASGWMSAWPGRYTYLATRLVGTAVNVAFPVLLVFWYYTGRPSRQLRLWRAGAN